MEFRVGYGTDIGRKRSQNQDNFAALPDLGLFVVADGMGGHRGGETASTMAVDAVTSVVSEMIDDIKATPRHIITEAVRAANRDIFTRASGDPQFHGMGTTTTALLFQNDVLTIGHVGDSRCYRFYDGGIWQITRDHSLVQEKLRAGLITRAELKTDRMKNVITRSVGFEPDVNVEIYEMNLRPGDTFLICSDGLSGLVEDAEMLKIIKSSLQQNASDSTFIQKTVENLIEAANHNGGDDNITTIMIEVVELSESSSGQARR